MVERIRSLIESRQLTPTQFADTIGVARPIISHILSGRNKPSLDVVQRILTAMPQLSMPWLLNGTGPMEPDAPQITPATADSGPKPASVPASGTTASTVPAPLAPAPNIRATPAEKPTSAPSNSRVSSSQSASIPAFKRFTASSDEAGKSLASPGTNPAGTVLASLPATEAGRHVAAPVPAAHRTPQAEREVPVQPASDAPAPEIPELDNRQVLNPPTTADALAITLSAEPDSANQQLGSQLLAASGKAIRRIVIFYHDGSFADYQPE